MEENVEQLARKICAAFLSHTMGLASVDYTLKTYVGTKPVGECWKGMARELLKLNPVAALTSGA